MAKVIYELASRGHDLSVPFGDNAKFDLVLEDHGILYRIQCKTAWMMQPGSIQINTHSQTTKDGECYESTYVDEIDAFVVWDREKIGCTGSTSAPRVERK